MYLDGSFLFDDIAEELEAAGIRTIKTDSIPVAYYEIRDVETRSLIASDITREYLIEHLGIFEKEFSKSEFIIRSVPLTVEKL